MAACDCSMGVPHVDGTRLVTRGLFYVNNTDVLGEVPYFLKYHILYVEIDQLTISYKKSRIRQRIIHFMDGSDE